MEEQIQNVPTLLSDRDFSRIAKVSVTTIRRWRAAGTGPKFKWIGGAIRYTVEDLNAWINAQPGGGE